MQDEYVPRIAKNEPGTDPHSSLAKGNKPSSSVISKNKKYIIGNWMICAASAFFVASWGDGGMRGGGNQPMLTSLFSSYTHRVSFPNTVPQNRAKNFNASPSSHPACCHFADHGCPSSRRRLLHEDSALGKSTITIVIRKEIHMVKYWLFWVVSVNTLHILDHI